MTVLSLTLESDCLTASLRERELETGRLILRAAAKRDAFLTRRATEAAAALDASPARRALVRCADALAGQGDVSAGLLAFGAVLERHGEHDAAYEAYRASLPNTSDSCAGLHVARAARRSGRREEALEMYRRLGTDCDDRHVRLLARIGEALVSADPLSSLTSAIGAARAAHDAEALAVAREERARYQLAACNFDGALRDLAGAAVRFHDCVDRVRVLHRMGELLSARGDLDAAREVLLAALDIVDDRARAHTVQRLRTVARSMGDQLELRRTRGPGNASITTLAATTSRRVPPGESRVLRLRRRRAALAG
jgi:tetratricopeptide (TPR) repeat protein